MIPTPCAHRPRTPGAPPTAFPQVALCCCLKLSKDWAAGFPEQCPTRALLTVQGEHRACPGAMGVPGGTQGGTLHQSFLPVKGTSGRQQGPQHLWSHGHSSPPGSPAPQQPQRDRTSPQGSRTPVGGQPCWASKHASLPQGPAGLRHFCNLGGLIYSPCFTFACLLLSGPKRTGTGRPPTPHLPT